MQEYQTAIEVSEPANTTFLAEVNPTLLLHYGGSAAAIILAVAFLLRAVADLIRVLVPVMLHRSDKESYTEHC